jgi:hypothetical protein
MSNVEDVKRRAAADLKSVPSSDLVELATRINTDYAAIVKADREAMTANHNIVERAISLGQMLHAAKDRAGHGEWLTWLKANCPDLPERTAQRYMNLSTKSPKLREKMKSATMADLTLKSALDLADDKTSKKSAAKTALDRFENAWSKLDIPTQQAFVEANYADLAKLMKEVDRKTKAA